MTCGAVSNWLVHPLGNLKGDLRARLRVKEAPRLKGLDIHLFSLFSMTARIKKRVWATGVIKTMINVQYS